MKHLYDPTRFLFYCICISLLTGNPVIAKVYKPTVKDTIVQSPYYDAFQLSLASRGINVFSYRSGHIIKVMNLSTGRTLASLTDDNPAKRNDTIGKLIEQTFDIAASERIIKEILARNAGIREDDPDSVFSKAYPSATTDPNYSGIVFDALIRQVRSIADTKGVVTGFVQSEQTILPTGGGSAAAIFADGISQFIIDRMKEDINTHVISQMKKVFMAHEEFQVLFPECWSLLKYNDDFTYSFYMNNLKPAFEKDLRSFLGNVGRLSNLPKYLELCKSDVTVCMIFTMFDVINGLQEQDNIANIIQKVYASPYIQETDFTETNLIKLTGYISFCLRDKASWENYNNNRKWITAEMFRYILTDAVTRKFYMGLIYKNEPRIQFGNFTNPLLAVLKDKNPDREKEFTDGFFSVTEQISNTVDNLNNLVENDRNSLRSQINLAKYQYYLELVSQTLDLTERTFEYVNIQDPGFNRTIKKVTRQLKYTYLPVVKTGLTVAENIDQKQYSLAIFNTNILIRKVLTNFTDTVLVEKINNTQDPDKKAKYKETQHYLRQFNKYFFTYSNLIASIAMAQNGKEVSEAINAVALPAGSSKIKKTSSWNLALNAYFGGYYRPVQSGDTSIIRRGFTKTWGFTAPVGLAGSVGFNKGGSLSIFAGIIDVGQIVQYRIVHDTIAKTTVAMPEIQWGDIVSPSLQLIYGFPWYIPLSIGAGCQLLPMKISDNKLKFKPCFSASITYDIPIINILNKRK